MMHFCVTMKNQEGPSRTSNQLQPQLDPDFKIICLLERFPSNLNHTKDQAVQHHFPRNPFLSVQTHKKLCEKPALARGVRESVAFEYQAEN